MRWVRGQRRVIALLAFVMSLPILGDAAPPTLPKPMNAAEIQLGLQKLNVLGRMLYVAAHPDDENTNLMALWSNGSIYDAAYMSIMRGYGGQHILGIIMSERMYI